MPKEKYIEILQRPLKEGIDIRISVNTEVSGFPLRKLSEIPEEILPFLEEELNILCEEQEKLADIWNLPESEPPTPEQVETCCRFIEQKLKQLSQQLESLFKKWPRYDIRVSVPLVGPFCIKHGDLLPLSSNQWTSELRTLAKRPKLLLLLYRKICEVEEKLATLDRKLERGLYDAEDSAALRELLREMSAEKLSS